MAENLFISNFKRLPRAVTLAVLIIFLIEMGSAVLLHIFKSRCMGEGDLFIAEGILSHLKLNGPSVNIPYNNKYNFKMYGSVREMARHGPYDIIVFGSSVGETGWVEMLRIDYGFNICKSVLSSGFDHPMANIISLICYYPEINKNRPAILLWADLTERNTRNFKNLGDLPNDIARYGRVFFEFREVLRTPATRLFYYLGYQIENIYHPLVKIINIGPRDELFYMPDLDGLYRQVSFNPGEYAKLSRDLKYYQKLAAKNGCILAMAAFPNKPQQYEWLINMSLGSDRISERVNLRILEKAARENNIPFLNLEAELDKITRNVYRQEGRLLWNRAESHMNQLGTRYCAEIIKSFIEDIGLKRGLK